MKIDTEANGQGHHGRGRWRRMARRARAVALLVGGGLGFAACNGVTDEGKLPPDVADPKAVQTASGAMARYQGALTMLPGVFDSLVTMTGILTDELASLPAPPSVLRAPYSLVDSRQNLEAGFAGVYAGLNHVRGQAQEARGFVAAYVPDSSSALAGHLYALEGYAEVFLADVFCSGIPLSTVDFNADYTLAAGSSTADVYRHAIALFDTALALTNDSVRIQLLAALGKGRALLALGQYAAAVAAVAAVPDAYRYQVVFAPLPRSLLQIFGNGDTASFRSVAATPGAADREGFNGLDYRSSGDPRTAATALAGTDPFGHTMYFPNKYPLSGVVTLTVADGIEARLIEAEAALQANPADVQWLALLNHLRETAITPALPDTSDPGTDAARVDLLFRERAFWLYLTGHRQGDLRRLVREYLRSQESVYPAGLYQGGSGFYGTQVVAPVPMAEQQLNPLYTGCLHLNA